MRTRSVCFWFFVLVWLTLSPNRDLVAQEPDTQSESISPLDGDGRLVGFERDIVPIFSARCLKCHGPDDAKNDFRVDQRETMMDYLEPEDLESSALYTDYLIARDEDMLMPPNSHGGPLVPSELALIRVWIEEGADWPDGVVFPMSAADPAVELTPSAIEQTVPQRIWAAQGFLHPAMVHFPIALLILGAGFVVLSWKWPKLGTQIPMACLFIGSITAIAATLMGWAFADERGYGSWARFDAAMMDREIFWHRWSGVILAIVSTVFALIALLSLRNNSPKLATTWKIGLLCCAAMVGAVGHQGGEMSFGKDFYPRAWRVLTGQPEIPQIESPDDVTVEG